jgi:hypothetical protein
VSRPRRGSSVSRLLKQNKKHKSLKSYFSFQSLFIAAVLGISVISIKEESRAQNASSQPMETTGTMVAETVGVQPGNRESSSIFVTNIPTGYRDWRLVSVAHEEGNLNDIRAILGNDIAIKAYRDGDLPFPEGTIIARVAWSCFPSKENNRIFGRPQSFVAGPPTDSYLQFLVKDSKKYSATGGWGFAQFNQEGKAANETVLQSCFPCHRAIDSRDFVFTRYSP